MPKLLHKAAVDDVPVPQGNGEVDGRSKVVNICWQQDSLDAVDGEGRGCDISGHDTFPDSAWWRLEDFFLLICNKTHE